MPKFVRHTKINKHNRWKKNEKMQRVKKHILRTSTTLKIINFITFLISTQVLQFAPRFKIQPTKKPLERLLNKKSN